jgi:hypothetical protein
MIKKTIRHKYFIQEHLHKEVFHGGIGNVDAERILKDNGYKPIQFPHHFNFSIGAKIGRLQYLRKMVFSIPARSTVVFQFPLYARMHKMLLKLLLLRKNIRVICFVTDINGLKDGDEELLNEEIAELKKYRHFIVHNKAMKNWLEYHVPKNKSATIEFFDFLAQPATIERQLSKAVVFAGNLEKSGFLHQLHQWSSSCENITMYLYGNGFTPKTPLPANVVYKTTWPPYELPEKIEGSFGLVWDGDSVYRSGGPLGSYMQFISHHKLSLYILSGMPIITASWAASAELVNRYQIGFTIPSLLDIGRAIEAITPEEYAKMVANTKALAKRISRGQNLLDALALVSA